MSQLRRVALVTGANRGLGLETARRLSRDGLRALLSSRDGLAGKAAAVRPRRIPLIEDGTQYADPHPGGRAKSG